MLWDEWKSKSEEAIMADSSLTMRVLFFIKNLACFIAANKLILLMQRGGYVYIMASPNKAVLYIGVTSDLYIRVYEHRHNPASFTAKYNCSVLVYYRGFDRIEEAIAEEKRLKAGNRKQKEGCIDLMNPEWLDLWDEVKNW